MSQATAYYFEKTNIYTHNTILDPKILIILR